MMPSKRQQMNDASYSTNDDNTNTGRAVELSQVEEDASTAMDVEVTQTTTTTGSTGQSEENEGIVYVVVDGYMSQAMKIKVLSGYHIVDIKEAIKSEGSPAFDSIAAFDIELYQSEQHEESLDERGEEIRLKAVKTPMDARTIWNSKATWGTIKQPLIVRKPPPIQTGKCILISIRFECCCAFIFITMAVKYPYSPSLSPSLL
jgi:hypothetical protein